MNYLDYFAKGGKTKSSEVINGIQSILGVDDAQMAELWQIGLNKYGSEDGIAQAIDEATKSLTDQSSPEEVKAAISSVFVESEMFKCGGKLQKLAQRFAKGSSVDCGCNGVKIKKNAEGGPASRVGAVARGRYEPSDYHNNIGDWVPVDGGVAQNYRPFFIGGKNWGIGGNALEQVLVTEGFNGTPRKVIRRIEGFFDNGIPTEKLDTTIYDAEGNTRHTKRFIDSVNSKLEGLAPARMQNGGLARAKAYYRNHANEGIIRKIQNFLLGRGYDVGDLDGIFGQRTYDAIRAYQRDNNLVDDGMWGENTNLVHRVLGAGDTTFNGPHSGAHIGTHTFKDGFLEPYDTRGNVSYKQINDTIERAVSNPEWFWGNSNDAKSWRLFFQKQTPDGYGAILKQIYDSTPDDIRKNIDLNKMPTSLASSVYNQNIRNAQTEAAPRVLDVLTLPVALANPIATAGAVAGGYAGATAGRQIGEDWSWRNRREDGTLGGWHNQNPYLYQSETGAEIPLVNPDKSTQGTALGAAIGSVLGGAVTKGLADTVEPDFRHNPSGIEQRVRPEVKEIKTTKSVGSKTKTTRSSSGKGKYTYKTDWRPTPPKRNPDGTWKNSTNGTGWVAKGTGEYTDTPIPEWARSGYFTYQQGGIVKGQSSLNTEKFTKNK